MKEIFISYSTLDLAAAETVRDVLETNGLSCWMAPRDIPGGSNYTKEIPIAIRGCTVFVLILSQNAQNSHWVLKELDSAVNAGKVILPFMLEDCDLNDEFNFLLTGAQRYAAYQKKAEALETLIRRIHGILNTPDAPVTVSARDKVASAQTNSDPVCPGCGGAELTSLPHRVKRHGVELLTLLFIPAFMVFLPLLVTIISAFIRDLDFTVFTWLFLIAAVLGAILGNELSKIIVRRSRLRKRILSTCYRCNRCRKVFLHDAPL